MLSTIAACGTLKKEIGLRRDSEAFLLWPFSINPSLFILSKNRYICLCNLHRKRIVDIVNIAFAIYSVALKRRKFQCKTPGKSVNVCALRGLDLSCFAASYGQGHGLERSMLFFVS